MKNYLFSIFLICFLFSCSSYKIETFYIGNGGTQYFLPPIEFDGEAGIATIDFTYRYTPDEDSPVTCNFSMFIPEQLNNIPTAVFVVANSGKANSKKIDSDTVRINNMKQIFRDFAKMEFRYSGTINAKDFNRIFEGNLSLFIVSGNNTVSGSNTQMEFSPSGGFEKAVDVVRKTVLPNLK